jgi:hypothetical protein
MREASVARWPSRLFFFTERKKTDFEEISNRFSQLGKFVFGPLILGAMACRALKLKNPNVSPLVQISLPLSLGFGLP